MASCEKCWSDAYWRTKSDPMKDQAQHYKDLIGERKDTPCTPEDTAGPEALHCTSCNRVTIHPYSNVCMACGAKLKNPDE